MLKCRELVAESSALLEGELSWRQRMSVRMHVLMCHRCRRFLRQFRNLLTGLASAHGRATPAEVQRVMQRVEREATS